MCWAGCSGIKNKPVGGKVNGAEAWAEEQGSVMLLSVASDRGIEKKDEEAWDDSWDDSGAKSEGISTETLAGEEGGEGRRGVVTESGVGVELLEERADDAAWCRRLWGLYGWGCVPVERGSLDHWCQPGGRESDGVGDEAG